MRRLGAAVVTALALGAGPAHAAPRWVVSQADRVPLEYFQGLTHDAAGDWAFAGVFEGLYRTDRDLREKARVPAALPADVKAQGFNHIGDPTYDSRADRLLLPLECYTPGAPNGGNTCGRGAIGIADPRTLAWLGLVPLDPADIPKAMWAEVAPGGRELYTSAGGDVLVYRTADLVAGAAVPPRPARVLRGVVPAGGITGATFYRGRLYLAGQGAGLPRLWSLDPVAGGALRVEAELPVAAESEGLDVLIARGGLLQWLLTPFAPGGAKPTYGTGHSELVTLVPHAMDRLHVAARRAGRRVEATVRIVVSGHPLPVAGATVRGARRAATTDAHGVARIALPAGRTVSLRATKGRLRPGTVRVRG
ncbi:MAG: hypothetical protein ACXVFL_06145 [Solirubrobacteraceae bacterium]